MILMLACVWLGASLVMLLGSSHFLIKSSIRLASLFHLPPNIAGLVLLAVGTSLPELIISLNAVWQGNLEVSMGNIMGSNLANVLLIVGSVVLFFPAHKFAAARSLWRENALLLFVTLIFGGVIVWGAPYHVLGGVVLLGCGCLFLWNAFLSRSFEKIPTVVHDTTKKIHRRHIFTVGGSFVLSVAVLQISAIFVLESAETIGQWFGWSQIIIGVILLAVGTSLPELAVSLTAIWQGNVKIFWGNIIGSNILNVTFVGGLVVLFSANFPVLSWIVMMWFVLCGLAFWIVIAFSQKRISQSICWFFLPSYGLFLALLFRDSLF